MECPHTYSLSLSEFMPWRHKSMQETSSPEVAQRSPTDINNYTLGCWLYRWTVICPCKHVDNVSLILTRFPQQQTVVVCKIYVRVAKHVVRLFVRCLITAPLSAIVSSKLLRSAMQLSENTGNVQINPPQKIDPGCCRRGQG